MSISKRNREQALADCLMENRVLSLNDAMELLGVSESTTRRLFSKLEQDGVAIRTHGGIRSVRPDMTLYSFEQGAKTNIDKKNAIAKAACELLEDGDVLFCDSGTTIQTFCSYLIRRIQQDHLSVKVYTNSLANFERLLPHTTVTLIGGEYRVNRRDFCGYLTEQALHCLHFTKCLLGADGFGCGNKFTTTDFDSARMNEVAIKCADKTILLVDSSKFSTVSHVAYVSVQELDTIVSDDQLPEKYRQQLEKAAVNVLYANVEPQT